MRFYLKILRFYLRRKVVFYYIIYIKRDNFNKNNFDVYEFSSSFIPKVSKFLFILNNNNNYYYVFSCGFYFLCLILLLIDVDDVVGLYVPSYCYFELYVEFFFCTCILVSCLPTEENI